MPKFEIQLGHRTRGDIDRIVDAVANHPDMSWEFVYDGEVHPKDGNDTSIYFQMGLTMGAKGQMFICGPDESDLIHLRMKAGL